MRNGPRKHLLSQLAHVELLTPTLAESVEFFAAMMGLTVTHRTAESAYLRCWGEFQHHSLKLTQADAPGLGHVAWRADSPDALGRTAAAIEAAGLGCGWTDGDHGHGRAFRFKDPDGHLSEVFWDVERFRTTGPNATPMKTRSARQPLGGAGVRRIDHVTLSCGDLEPVSEFFIDTLGFLQTERVRIGDTDELLLSTLTVNCRDHDLNLVKDYWGASGRLSHLAFWCDTRDEIMRFADICVEYDLPMQFGPSRHRGTELFFLYVTEPGGNMIEYCTGGYLVFEPDWEVVDWSTDDNQAVMWATEFPEHFYTKGTPPVTEHVTRS
jgi:catechol 2,3-dioxygenase